MRQNQPHSRREGRKPDHCPQYRRRCSGATPMIPAFASDATSGQRDCARRPHVCIKMDGLPWPIAGDGTASRGPKMVNRRVPHQSFAHGGEAYPSTADLSTPMRSRPGSVNAVAALRAYILRSGCRSRRPARRARSSRIGRAAPAPDLSQPNYRRIVADNIKTYLPKPDTVRRTGDFRGAAGRSPQGSRLAHLSQARCARSSANLRHFHPGEQIIDLRSGI